MVYTIKNKSKGELRMKFNEHKKTYQERMEKLGCYTTRIPSMSLANHYQITFTSKTRNLKMTSNARIEDDVLCLLPLFTNIGNNKLDFLVVLDYWAILAKWKGLSSIRLTTTKYNEDVVKTWNNLNELQPMVEQIGFTKRNGSYFEILINDVPDLIDMRMTITNLLNTIHVKDLSFNFTDDMKSDPSSFYEVHFEWRGLSKKFLFYCRDKSYSFIYEGRIISFTQETIAQKIETILQEIEESVKLKNLLEPPFVNVLRLLSIKCGLSKNVDSETLAKNIMNAFINLGIPYEQVEAEAVRIKKSNTSKTNNSTLPYKEALFQFFDSHFALQNFNKRQSNKKTSAYALVFFLLMYVLKYVCIRCSMFLELFRD